MISAIANFFMRSHNQLNPFVVDLSDLHQGADQAGAATAIQARWRGRQDRDKVEMQTVVTSSKNIEGRLSDMQAELKSLRDTVDALKRELAKKG